MKLKWLRNFLKGCSLTTALFVFTACYGTPQGLDPEPINETATEQVTEQEGEAVEENAAATSEVNLAEEGQDNLGQAE